MRLSSIVIAISLLLQGCVSHRPSPLPKFQYLCDPKLESAQGVARIRLTKHVEHPALYLRSGPFTVFVSQLDLITMLEARNEEFKSAGGSPDSVMLLSTLEATMPLTADSNLDLYDRQGTNNLLVAQESVGYLLERGSAVVLKETNTDVPITLGFITVRNVKPEPDGVVLIAYCDAYNEDILSRFGGGIDLQ